MAIVQIEAAACMLVGLKYAGTADDRARTTLQHHADAVARRLISGCKMRGGETGF